MVMLMGMKNKVIDKAAQQISGQSEKLFNDILRVQESMHGYLEKLLECEREQLNELRFQNKKPPKEWKDEMQ